MTQPAEPTNPPAADPSNTEIEQLVAPLDPDDDVLAELDNLPTDDTREDKS
jgi:hypothetical protein